jgi:hypothetical protein
MTFIACGGQCELSHASSVQRTRPADITAPPDGGTGTFGYTNSGMPFPGAAGARTMGNGGDHRGAFGGRLAAIHGAMAHHRPCGNCVSRRGRRRGHVR